jgi:hypothetical protein
VDRSPDDAAPPTEVVVLGAAHGGAEVELTHWALERDADAADLAVVDQLARLQLAARRMGASVRVRHAGSELVRLLVAVGLGDLVGPG